MIDVYPRDVRTLLLCNVNSHYARYAKKATTYKELYSKLYQGSNTSQFRQFVTFGNFDAISIYKTEKTDGADWLKGVEEDNNLIAQNITNTSCFLPIHLVTYQDSSSFWTNSACFPICLTTVVYGVQKANSLDSSCDVIISKFLSNLKKISPPPDGSSLYFATYQAINICDAVVFWMTNDIHYALDLSTHLVRDGIARKTYTLVGIDREQIITDDDESAKMQLSKTMKGANELFQVRIQGSIRDHKKALGLFFDEKHRMIDTWIGPEAKIATSSVFGNEDFTMDVQLPGVDSLLGLFFGMLENSWEVSLSCWEIHTEFTGPAAYNNAKEYISPKAHPIETAFENYKKSYTAYLGGSLALYPWASAYLELLATHVNIDHDPVLHAPASLFLGLANIANAYFQRASFPSKYQQLFQDVLRHSNSSILRLIRHWSHLTDQLTQSDDLVFHGIGRDPSIFEALPESILKYYHSYVCRVVNNIIQFGDKHNPNWTEWDYAFDFLLVPEHGARTRISKMFKTTELHQVLLADFSCTPTTCKDCKTSSDCKYSSAWPEKQVYLVEFQTSLLYDPPNFLFPVLHECFHIFGDRFRLRMYRADYLVDIITLEIQYQLGLAQPWNKELGDELRKRIKVDKPAGLNCNRLATKIYDNLRKIFETKSSGSYDEIKNSLHDPYYLMSNEVYGKWKKITEEFHTQFPPSRWHTLIKNWVFYFRECYADLMSLLWLCLPLDTYLRQVELDWSMDVLSETDQGEATRYKYIQRISLVLAAYTVPTWKKEGLTRDEALRLFSSRIEPYFNLLENSGFISSNKEAIIETFLSLLVKSYKYSEHKYRAHPDKLAFVFYYLLQVRYYFIKYMKAEAKTKEDDVRQKLILEYTDFFRDGKQFTEPFNRKLDE